MTATLESVLRHWKDRLAVLEWSKEKETTRTYGELHERALKAGAGLKSFYSLVPGDRIVLLSNNGVDFLEMLLACSFFGFIPVLVDFSDYSIDEVREAFIYSSEFEEFKRKQTGIQRLSALTDGLDAFSDSGNDTEDTEYDEETGRRLPSRREREEQEAAANAVEQASGEGARPSTASAADEDITKKMKNKAEESNKANSALIPVPEEPPPDMAQRIHGPRKTETRRQGAKKGRRTLVVSRHRFSLFSKVFKKFSKSSEADD